MGARHAGALPKGNSFGQAANAIDKRRICKASGNSGKTLETTLATNLPRVGGQSAQTLSQHRDALLVFLHHVDVPAHNNACERALRPSVIHRKVMGSFRSDWVAQGYAALATILNTAKRHGQSTFQKLVALMGQPVLPFIEASA